MFPRPVSAKGRGEVFPVYSTEAYRGNRGIAALCLNFGVCTGVMIKKIDLGIYWICCC
jgi:hypothetical protein